MVMLLYVYVRGSARNGSLGEGGCMDYFDIINCILVPVPINKKAF